MDFRKIFKKRPIPAYLAAARMMMIWPLQKMRWGGVGPFCRIVKPIRIINRKKIFLGRNVTILNGARLEVIRNWAGGGQKKEIVPKLLIEDRVSIGQNCHIVAANKVVIGRGCLLSSNIFISDCNHGYMDLESDPIAQPLECSETEIGEGTFLGTGVKVLPGVHIGRHCVLGANAVVTKDIPPYSVAVGIPAKVIKKYDVVEKKWNSC